jgi:F-type H+-transporting ATPase subunit gamma
MAGESRAVKNRIVSTKKTAQITKAMNMVSASKLRKAQRDILEFRPFVKKAHEIIVNLMSTGEKLEHPLLETRPIQKKCYIIISSDRGLAGSFNANVIKKLQEEVSTQDKDEFVVYPLGANATAFCEKMGYSFIDDYEYVAIRDKVEFSLISQVIEKVITEYLLKRIDQVIVLHNHFVNTLTQNVEKSILLPVEAKALPKDAILVNYEFDGSATDILNLALPIYIENSIYSYILDSKASEHAARMNSMKNATDNAKEVIHSLELLYNRARQQAITLELTDIVGGASIVNEN